MSVSPFVPELPVWDPSHEDLQLQHGVHPQQPSIGKPAQYPTPETPQQLHAMGWMDCPRCHQFWINPETKEMIHEHGGYFTCPKCRYTSLVTENLPWHGALEEDYYPRGGMSGGGTSVGIPMEDVGQIAENIIQGMREIPGYGAIAWWHPGPAGGVAGHSDLDGATAEWGIEVKGRPYDAAIHFWDPRSGDDPGVVDRKNAKAKEMGLKGVLGLLVLENFRTDRADVYLKEMPLSPWRTPNGQMKTGIVRWHKRTGTKIASGIPFDNPMKDPHNPAPGPYSLEQYYNKPKPTEEAPTGEMPF